MINIKDNIAAIEQQILQACQKNDRKFSEVCLLAVSKTKPNALIEQAYQAGQRHFGENYCQEALEKTNQLKHLNDIYWHFIGPIQANKTKLISENFAWVHSVERLKIIARLNNQRAEYCAVHPETPALNICLQVNISQEQSKSGIMPEQIDEFAERVAQSAHLTLRGLMAIPQKDAPMNTYLHMQDLYIQLKSQYSSVDTLSLGMSSDLNMAIAAGSTMVRIGTAIFGARDD